MSIYFLSSANAQKLSGLGLVSELAYFKNQSENLLLVQITKLDGQKKAKQIADAIIVDGLKHISKVDSIKAMAELKKSKKIADSIYVSERNGFIIDYLRMKTLMDQFILQLSSNMYSKNSTCIYKKVDKLVKDFTGSELVVKEKLKPYYDGYKELGLQLSVLEDRKKRLGSLNFVIEDPLAEIELGVAIIKDVREANEKKVNNIVEILQSLRLSKVSEVLKDQAQEAEDDGKK